MKRILVGSKNPVKIEAAKKALAAFFPHEDIIADGINAPSHVPDQPWGSKETYQGAYNRALFCKNNASDDYDYFCGLEGGLETCDFSENAQTIAVFNWVVVLSRNSDDIGRSRGGWIELPQQLADLVKQYGELGPAADAFSKQSNTKQKGGTIGLLTGNTITRVETFAKTATMALTTLIKPWENTL